MLDNPCRDVILKICGEGHEPPYGDSFAVLNIKPRRQAFYYTDGRLRSFVADDFAAKMTEILEGKPWGHIAGTVTDSVCIETALFDMMANAAQSSRPYRLDAPVPSFAAKGGASR